MGCPLCLRLHYSHLSVLNSLSCIWGSPENCGTALLSSSAHMAPSSTHCAMCMHNALTGYVIVYQRWDAFITDKVIPSPSDLTWVWDSESWWQRLLSWHRPPLTEACGLLLPMLNNGQWTLPADLGLHMMTSQSDFGPLFILWMEHQVTEGESIVVQYATEIMIRESDWKKMVSPWTPFIVMWVGLSKILPLSITLGTCTTSALLNRCSS
jgi:hypothetical protein